MSSSDRGRGDTPGSHQEPLPSGAPSTTSDPGAADPYANWLDRMQRARARHAAITKNLYTWSNYKNWADKMRDNWEEGDDPDAKPAVNGAPGTKGAPGSNGLKNPLPRK